MTARDYRNAAACVRAESARCAVGAHADELRALGVRLQHAEHAARERALSRGVLSLTPGTPEHAARVAERGQTESARDGLWPATASCMG